MRRLIKLTVVNLLVLFVLMECLGLVEHYYSSGRLFYTHSQRHSTFESQGGGESFSTKLLHPYFGYLSYPIGTQRGELALNNHGFLSKEGDYPIFQRDSTRFVIGIFGGSVAEQVFVRGSRYIKKVLKKHPSFVDKELVVLSFAQPGYKQPQQLQLLTYFLSLGQHFDAVINLDGFNDVVLSEKNYGRGVDFSMPSAGHMLGMMDVLAQSKLDPGKLDVLAKIGKAKAWIEWSDSIANSTKLASQHLLLRFIRRIANYRYQQVLRIYEQLSWVRSEESVYFLPSNSVTAESESPYGQIAKYWARSSKMMKDLSNANAFTYLHVLQPNQYHSKHSFTAAEAAIAIDRDHIYRKGAEQGYPYLVREFEELRQSGVNFVNAVKLFDAEARPVYADACCHFNSLGIRLLAEFVADNVILAETEAGSLE